MAHKPAEPDTQDMAPCSCPPAALTCVRFADGVVMVRCGVHEQQSWSVDGRPAGRDDALAALKGVFVERRGERRTGRAPSPRPQVIRMTEPVAYDVAPEAGDDARLTALLRARGLSGTWAVA